MIAVAMFILGLIFGSFLNVLIIRIPLCQNIAYPASHCMVCHKPLRFYHNIPLFSWIFLKGQCSYCKSKISAQYPLIELISGLIFVICYFEEVNIYLSILTSLIFLLLLALSVIDLRYKAVPDALSIPALLLVLIHPEFFLRLENALIFAGAFALLRFIVSFVIKKEAMGEADIIIAAIIGGILGITNGLMAIYISALLALPAFLMVKKRGFELPFIPFLAFGLFIVYTFSTNFSEMVKYIYE